MISQGKVILSNAVKNCECTFLGWLFNMAGMNHGLTENEFKSIPSRLYITTRKSCLKSCLIKNTVNYFRKKVPL